jgi:ribosomal protein S18 acetylase RimI-like enzyme
MPITVRTATLADRATLTDFGRRMFEEAFAAQNTPGNMRAYLDEAFNEPRQTAELSDPARVTFFAEQDGMLVGYAQVHRRDAPDVAGVTGGLELVRLYVDRSAHGRGVAQELMRAVESIARQQGQPIWLGVWEHNPRAIAFYRKCGFSIVGSQHFKLGEDLQTDHVMVKVIGR